MSWGQVIHICMWFAVMLMASHHALKQNWGAAIFFGGFLVLIELAKINGRLKSIQSNTLKH